MLTVVTASHRNPEGLRHLAADLAPFLCEDLRWQVKDSGACPDTAAWGVAMPADHFGFDNTPDAGIYDALNRAIARVETEYYLVVGSDDRVFGDVLLEVAHSLAARRGSTAD